MSTKTTFSLSMKTQGSTALDVPVSPVGPNTALYLTAVAVTRLSNGQMVAFEVSASAVRGAGGTALVSQKVQTQSPTACKLQVKLLGDILSFRLTGQHSTTAAWQIECVRYENDQ